MWERVKGFGGKVLGVGKKAMRAVAALAVTGIVAVCGSASAADTVTIPSMPVDFADLAAQGAVILGTVVAGCIGVVVLVSLINMGISWMRRAFGGR